MKKKRRQIKSNIICHSKKKLAEERDGAVLDEMSSSEVGSWFISPYKFFYYFT
jgi:hypothetical protein